jgi:hypothetical protein
MSKASNSKKPSASSTSNLRKGGGRTQRRAILTEQHAFCSAYVRIGSATGTAVYAGYHPASGHRMLENSTIKTQIEKLQGQAERREEQLAEKTFVLMNNSGCRPTGSSKQVFRQATKCSDMWPRSSQMHPD